MSRILSTALCALILPLGAQAQDIYATPEGCARLAGEGTTADGAVTWTVGEKIEFYETTCAQTDMGPIGGGAVVLTLMCSGEGETWEEYYIAQTTADADTYVLYPEANPDIRTKVSTCP